MPVLRVPDADLESAVIDIERTSRVVQMSPAGDGAWLLLVEARRKAPARETR